MGRTGFVAPSVGRRYVFTGFAIGVDGFDVVRGVAIDVAAGPLLVLVIVPIAARDTPLHDGEGGLNVLFGDFGVADIARTDRIAFADGLEVNGPVGPFPLLVFVGQGVAVTALIGGLAGLLFGGPVEDVRVLLRAFENGAVGDGVGVVIYRDRYRGHRIGVELIVVVLVAGEGVIVNKGLARGLTSGDVVARAVVLVEVIPFLAVADTGRDVVLPGRQVQAAVHGREDGLRLGLRRARRDVTNLAVDRDGLAALQCRRSAVEIGHDIADVRASIVGIGNLVFVGDAGIGAGRGDVGDPVA